MQSGKLRHRVTLQRRVDCQAPSGAIVHSWQDVAEVAAEVMPGRGREFFAAAQIQATAPAEIKIRSRGDIDETWRIKYAHGTDLATVDYYEIMAPPIADAKTGRRTILLMCNLRRADGWRG